MVKQYPHYLYILTVPASTQDASGNWVNNTGNSTSWTFHSVCREETNGKGSTINGPDGKSIVYSSAVYLPKSAGNIKEGATVVISQFNDPTDGVRIKGQALKFDNSQLSKRLWV